MAVLVVLLVVTANMEERGAAIMAIPTEMQAQHRDDAAERELAVMAHQMHQDAMQRIVIAVLAAGGCVLMIDRGRTAQR